MQLSTKTITYGTDFLKLKVEKPYLTDERLMELSKFTSGYQIYFEGCEFNIWGLDFIIAPSGHRGNMCNIIYKKPGTEGLSVGSYFLPIHRIQTQLNKKNSISSSDYERLELTGTFFEEFWVTYKEYNPILVALLTFFGVESYSLGRFDVRMDIVDAIPEGIFKCYKWNLKEKSVFYWHNKYKETIYLGSNWRAQTKKIRIYDKKLDIIKKNKHTTSDYCNSLIETPGNITRAEIEFTRVNIRENKREHSIEEMEAFAFQVIKYDFWIDSWRVYRNRKADKIVHADYFIEHKIFWTLLWTMRNMQAAKKYVDLWHKMHEGPTDDIFKDSITWKKRWEFTMFNIDNYNFVKNFDPDMAKDLLNLLII